MNRGWIKLWRANVDNPLYFSEPFTKWQALTDLLLLANHKDNTVFVRGIPVTVKAGQVLAGEDFLSKRWKWSRNKTRRFMYYLSSKKVQQIEQHKNNVCTLVSILNYTTYHCFDTAEETPDDTTKGQQKDIPKNDKNEEKNISGCEIAEEETAKPTRSVSDQFREFLTRYNQETGQKAKHSFDAERQFYDSLKLGWTVDDMINATRKCNRDKWFKDNLKLNIEYITKPKSLNIHAHDKQPEKPLFHGVMNNWAGVEVDAEGRTYAQFMKATGQKTPLEIKQEKEAAEEAAALESQSV